MANYLKGLGAIFNRVQGSGVDAEETRVFSGISGVSLSCFGTLRIIKDEKEYLLLRAEENLLEYFESELNEEGILSIDIQNNVFLSSNRPVIFELHVQKLNTIKNNSSGEIFGPDLEAVDFTIRTSGSGSVELGKITASKTDIKLISSGDVVLDQLITQDARITSSGSGRFKSDGLHAAGSLFVKLSSSGNLESGDLTASDFTAESSGSGDYVIASGSTKNLNLKMNSSGKFNAENFKAGAAQTKEISIRLTGSGDARFTELSAQKLQVVLTSAGSLESEKVFVGRLEATQQGSGDFDISEGLITSCKLKLSSSGKFFASDCKASETASDESSIILSGSGKAEIGEIHSKKVEFKLLSSGGLRVDNLQAEKLSASLSGNGNLRISSGRAVEQEVKTNSSGNYRADGMSSSKAVVTTSGSGSMRIQVSDHLEARISGSGSVRYSGSPEVVQKGSGEGNLVQDTDFSEWSNH